MLCKKCGKELGENPEGKFCPQCGAQIILPQHKEKRNRTEPKVSKSKKFTFIGIFIGLLLIGGGYLLTHASPKVVVKDGVCYIRDGLFQGKES